MTDRHGHFSELERETLRNEQLENHINLLRAENEALRADAERYRAIRPHLEIKQQAGTWWLGETDHIGYGEFGSVDAAIDALRNSE